MANEVREIEDTRKVIETDFSRDIFVGKADSENVESDEVVKGEVKTQKDKLMRILK